jgi:hypothetical protein
MSVAPVRSSITAAVVVLTYVLGRGAASDDTIPFPLEYREWSHVKSALVGPQSPAFSTEAGIHHVYANPKALEGYRQGSFPDGSILVYDLLETREEAGITSEGRQKRVDVMVKDRRRYADSAGWGFASFKGSDRTNGTLGSDRKAACVGCHAKQRDHDSVFSEFRR